MPTSGPDQFWCPESEWLHCSHSAVHDGEWGEISSSADRTGAGGEFSQPHYLLPVCQEAGDPLTDGGGDGELCQVILKGVRDDGVKGLGLG